MTRVYRARRCLSTTKIDKGDKRREVGYRRSIWKLLKENGGARGFKAGPGRAKDKKKALRQAIHTLFTLISM